MNFEQFLEAVKTGRLEEVESCLISHPEFRNSSDDHGRTPLHFAAEYRQELIVELLLQRQDPWIVKQSANSRDGGGKIPLHNAVWKKHYAIVKLLIQAGSDIDSPDKYGRTPLHVASRWGYDPKIAELLICAGSVVDSPDNDGMTPLHMVSRWGRDSEVAKLLLQKQVDDLRTGSSFDSPDSGGYTPLSLVAMGGNKSIAKLLLQAGASVNHSTKIGRTPLYLSISYGHKSIVKLLLRRQASWIVKQVDDPRAGTPFERSKGDGSALLHYAIMIATSSRGRREHETIVKILKAVGASITPHPRFNLNQIQMITAPIPEEEILEIRARIYFDSSLVSRLLFLF